MRYSCTKCERPVYRRTIHSKVCNPDGTWHNCDFAINDKTRFFAAIARAGEEEQKKKAFITMVQQTGATEMSPVERQLIHHSEYDCRVTLYRVMANYE